VRKIPLLTGLFLVIAAIAGSPALARPGAAAVTNVTVTAGKPGPFSFTLSTKTVTSGVIVFKVTNKGTGLSHNFRLCSGRNKPLANSCTGRTTKMLSPGQSDTLRVTVTLKGTYEYLCTVPGHAAGGMKGLIKVT
jgi:uncharacterized cupredoxin-like copper-binding protein